MLRAQGGKPPAKKQKLEDGSAAGTGGGTNLITIPSTLPQAFIRLRVGVSGSDDEDGEGGDDDDGGGSVASASGSVSGAAGMLSSCSCFTELSCAMDVAAGCALPVVCSSNSAHESVCSSFSPRASSG